MSRTPLCRGHYHHGLQPENLTAGPAWALALCGGSHWIPSRGTSKATLLQCAEYFSSLSSFHSRQNGPREVPHPKRHSKRTGPGLLCHVTYPHFLRNRNVEQPLPLSCIKTFFVTSEKHPVPLRNQRNKDKNNDMLLIGNNASQKTVEQSSERKKNLST